MNLYKSWFFLLAISVAQLGQACTIWASIGSVNQSDQLLFIKNRDAPLQSWQQLQLISPAEGYRYLALRYKNQPSDPDFNFISAGINQVGLNIAVGDVHTATNFGNGPGSAIMQTILQHYASVDAVLKDQQRLFSHSTGQNFLIADRNQVISVEVAPEGHYAIIGPVKQGIVFQTNHYLDPALIPYNNPVSPSSFMRYNRIAELLQGSTTPYNVQQFKAFAADQHEHNPDGSIDTNNSILRKVTLATWLVAIPTLGAPVLYLQQRNPEQPKRDIRWVLDQAFWQQPA